MSGLLDFLTPFSHLVFANRDKVIVFLGALLIWFTIQLLTTRWRNERLEHDLAAAKTAPANSGGRRYAANTQAEEPPAETGVFPPIKGGRTYARNLGTALQKAGIAGPQIYSPPSPAGWAPNTNPSQVGMSQPGSGAPYAAPQSAPWAAPGGPPAAPWGYPSGPGRGMPGAPPSTAPFYQQQPSQQQQQPQSAPQPLPAAPPAGPGFYGPPAGSPYGQPAFQPVTSGPAAPAPNFAPPATPSVPAMPPAFGGNPPPVEPPAEAAGDAGRRGKPKRRRFNFNVLENLEKMVQPKTAEPAPATGWTPPAPSSAAAPVQPTLALPSLSPTTSPSSQPATAAQTSAPAKEAPAEADSLPLRFGPEVEPETVDNEPEAVAAEPEAVEAEPEAVEAQASADKTSDLSDESEASAMAEAEVETPTAEAAPEPTHEPKPSMRSMLFGEELMPSNDVAPAEEPAASESEPAIAEQADAEKAPELEPIVEAVEPEPEPWKPWQPSRDAEPEMAKAEVDEAPGADVPETPAGDRPSAGTVVIIEDDQTAASYYATLFRGNGYQVEVANDGVSGVDLCTRTQPQLILLDVMMPRQNGILVLQTLRASDETKNTPVVVMSNFSEPTLIKRAIQLGALEYVIKTQVEGPALLSALPRWINHEKAFAAA
jgi:CheY-like chemotaxis protein